MRLTRRSSYAGTGPSIRGVTDLTISVMGTASLWFKEEGIKSRNDVRTCLHKFDKIVKNESIRKNNL